MMMKIKSEAPIVTVDLIMQTIKKMFSAGLVIAAIGLCGCTTNETGSVRSHYLPEARRHEGNMGPEAGTPIRELTVRILPEFPTGITDLRTVCTGMDDVHYQWERNGILIAGANSSMLRKDQFLKGDRISVIISDRGKEVSSAVIIGNSLPLITSVFVNQFLYRGADIVVTPQAVDIDGDDIGFRFSWSINGEYSFEDTSILKGDRFKRGDRVVLTITPYDYGGDGEALTLEPLTIQNAPPRILSIPPGDVKSDTYFYYAQAEDPDDDILTYRLAAAPAGMTINNKTGEIVWEMNLENQGIHVVEIVVEDQEGAKSVQKYSLSLRPITVFTGSEQNKL